MNKNYTLIMISAAALVAIATPAFAISKDYQIGSGSSVTALSSDPGLVIQTSLDPALAGTAFTLNDGQSATFNFFEIWTDESTVNSDDTVAKTISATLNFVNPLVDPTIVGSTVGATLFYGIIQYGQVTWNGPVTVALPGDRTFEISLSNETFDAGLFGLTEDCGATVKATICQITSTNGVPETANTAMLLGMALVGMVWVQRTRFGHLPVPARIPKSLRR